MSERESKRLKRSFIKTVDYLQSSSALVMAVDTEGRLILINRVMEEATGYKLEEVQGSYIWEAFMPPVEGKLVSEVFGTFSPEDMPTNYTGNVVTRDGSTIMVAWSNRNLCDRDGKVEGYISTGIDITERSRTEEAMRRRDALFRSLIEGTMDVIVVIQADGIVRYASPSAERVAGYAPEELVGLPILNILHPDHLEQYMKVLKDILSDPGGDRLYEFWVKHKDGSLRIVEALGRNLLNDPAVEGIVVNCRDVTERCRYEQAMLEKAEELREFLGVAAHELRHPITVIKGYVSTLENYLGKIPPDSIPQMLTHMAIATDRLAHIVNDLLDVSRIERGGFPVEQVMSPIEPLLQQAVEEMRTHGTSHTFEVKTGSLNGPVFVDPDRCIQLLIILLENAANFSPANQPIEIEAALREGELLVSVHDMGPGVPEEASIRIFDRFVQLEDLRHHSKPGLGLGLYIAREIAQAHGGRIWHEPRAGGGSIFRFSLPMKSEAGGQIRHLREASGP